MKQILFLLCCSSITTNAQQNNCATIQNIEGLQIYICAAPGAKFTYIATIKKGFAITGEPEEMIKSMIKKCKKNYPGANALIFKNLALDEADAIFLQP
jgi:hypothetical protein